EELRHVDDEVADDGHTRQRPYHHRLLEIGNLGDAGEAVLAVDVHRVRAAYPLAAGAAEGKRGVVRLDPDQRGEQHAVGRVERDVVILHPRLLVDVRVVAVDG